MGPAPDLLGGSRPEVELLLCSARVTLDDAAAQRLLVLLQHDLNWPWLLAIARAHGLGPLLYWHLNQQAPASVPFDVVDDLRQRFLANARHSLLLTSELVRLLTMLGRHGIRAIPFKGPTLAAYAYGNLTLREFVDLDLLVTPADLAGARQLLVAEGYKSLLPLAPAQQEAYLATLGQIPLITEDRTCMVELHSRIAPLNFHFPLDLKRLWPRLQPLVLGAREIHVLAAEDLLLILCAHAAKHRWRKLGWVCDVAELLRARPALDWTAVVNEARSLRCQRILQLGLLLAHDVLKAPVPDDQLRSARASSTVRALATRAARQMLQGAENQVEGLEAILFHLRIRERTGDGLRYTLSLALAPTVADWTALRVRVPFTFVYHLIRVVRLALKYARLFLRRIVNLR